MEAEGWPMPRYDQFKGESPESYRRRISEIGQIQDGFRMGRYRGDLAEHMERRLVRLLEQPLEVRSA
ncbi:MAG TPA: hypothetical protein VHA07_10160 [Devosia sp.]|nr:hypothetical protein [Devosia sp.]